MNLEVFYENELICEIDVNFVTDEVKFKNYIDIVPLLPFGVREKATVQDFMDFVADRVFPRTRYNCDELLEKMGLQVYDEIEVLRFNHGLCTDDNIWVRFKGEEIDYEKEIKPFFDRIR